MKDYMVYRIDEEDMNSSRYSAQPYLVDFVESNYDELLDGEDFVVYVLYESMFLMGEEEFEPVKLRTMRDFFKFRENPREYLPYGGMWDDTYLLVMGGGVGNYLNYRDCDDGCSLENLIELLDLCLKDVYKKENKFPRIFNTFEHAEWGEVEYVDSYGRYRDDYLSYEVEGGYTQPLEIQESVSTGSLKVYQTINSRGVHGEKERYARGITLIIKIIGEGEEGGYPEVEYDILGEINCTSSNLELMSPLYKKSLDIN